MPDVVVSPNHLKISMPKLWGISCVLSGLSAFHGGSFPSLMAKLSEPQESQEPCITSQHAR